MRRKISYFFISTAALIGIAITGVAIASNVNGDNGIVADDITYDMNLTSANVPTAISEASDYTSATATPSRYAAIDYVDAMGQSGKHAVLKATTGSLANHVIINGINSLTATFTGSLTLQYGINALTEHSVALVSGNKTTVKANYFKVLAGSDAVALTSLNVNYSCNVLEGVSITMNNTDLGTQIVQKGIAVSGLAAPTKEGYVFKEWLDTAGVAVAGDTLLTADTTLVASYKALTTSSLATVGDFYSFTTMNDFTTNAVWINTSADGTSIETAIGTGNARVDASSTSASGAAVINVGLPLINYAEVENISFTLKFNYDAASLSLGGVSIVSSTKAGTTYTVSFLASGSKGVVYLNNIEKGNVTDSAILTGASRLGIALTRDATTMQYGQLLITKITQKTLDYKAMMATELASITDTAYSSHYLNYRNCVQYLTAYEKAAYSEPAAVTAVTSAISGTSQTVINWADPLKVDNDGTSSSYDTTKNYYLVQTQEKSGNPAALTRLDYHFSLPTFPFALTKSGQIIITSGYFPTISIGGTVVNNMNSSWAVWDFSTSSGVVTLTEENTKVAITLDDQVAKGEVGLSFTLTLQSTETYNESSFRPWTMKF